MIRIIRHAIISIITILGCAITGAYNPIQLEMPSEAVRRITPHLSVSRDDQFRLTFGWHEEIEKTYFDESEFTVIYNVLNSFSPLEGPLPWEDDASLMQIGAPTALHIVSDANIIVIYFSTHGVLDITYANVIDSKSQDVLMRFTVDYNLYREMEMLLRQFQC